MKKSTQIESLGKIITSLWVPFLVIFALIIHIEDIFSPLIRFCYFCVSVGLGISQTWETFSKTYIHVASGRLDTSKVFEKLVETFSYR